MIVQHNSSLFSSEKTGASSSKSWAQVVSQVFLPLFSKEYESDSSVMHSDTNCQVYYSGNYVTSKSRHLKEDTQLISACNRSYEVHFGIEGDHQRQTYYPILQ